jgi:branched-chain amino acid transport system substrate-binding protein
MTYLKNIFGAGVFALMMFIPNSVWAADILVGFSGPLSGIAADYGLELYNGLDMATREINAAGGVKVKGKKYNLRLERLDDKADPTQALNNAKRFKSNGAIAVVNGVYTTTVPLMKVNEEKGNEFLMLAFTSTPSVTEAGNKLVISPNVPFTINVDLYTDWAKSKGYKTCAFVPTLGPYGDEWRRAFRASWEKKGGIVTIEKPANYYTETDFSAPLTAALATKPDFMLIGGPSGATALVVEQARGMGFKGGFVFIDQAKVDVITEMLKGRDQIGTAIAVAGMKTMPEGAAKRFALKYQGIYKRVATWEASVNYCLMHSLVRAIEAAQSADDVYKIRAAYPKAFPMMLGDFPKGFPMEILGVSEHGRWQTFTSIQPINDGKLDLIYQYAWWVKSEAEFKAQSKRSDMNVKGIIQKWHKVPEN